MASQLYQLGIKLLNIYLKLSAVLGNKKAKIGNQGRGYWKENIKKLNSNKMSIGQPLWDVAKMLIGGFDDE